MRVVDLSHPISEPITVYPGTPQPSLQPLCTYEKDHYRETWLSLASHTGTHVDAPAHLLQDGRTLDTFSVDQFVGTALTISCTHLQPGERITMQCLEACRPLADRAQFLLFHLGWDRYFTCEHYFEGYPVMDDAVVSYLLQSGKKGVGVDTPSVDPVSDWKLPNHKRLLSSGSFVILENLTNLSQTGSDLFWLFALPLSFEHADGAPMRAIAFWPDAQ